MTTTTTRKGFAFTPRTRGGYRFDLQISPADRIRSDLAMKHGQPVTVVDLRSGTRFTVRRADCGLGCMCDAEVVECVPVTLDGMTQQVWDLTPRAIRTRITDTSGLSEQLSGREGWRVEVVDEPGAKPRRFIVGRSTGWRPCNLEIPRKNSMGGDPARKRYHSVVLIERVRS